MKEMKESPPTVLLVIVGIGFELWGLGAKGDLGLQLQVAGVFDALVAIWFRMGIKSKP